jgi:hypothetical protein
MQTFRPRSDLVSLCSGAADAPVLGSLAGHRMRRRVPQATHICKAQRDGLKQTVSRTALRPTVRVSGTSCHVAPPPITPIFTRLTTAGLRRALTNPYSSPE